MRLYKSEHQVQKNDYYSSDAGKSKNAIFYLEYDDADFSYDV